MRRPRPRCGDPSSPRPPPVWTGPIVTPCWSGAPRTIAPAERVSPSASSSATVAATRTRPAALQTCPAFVNAAEATAADARSMSASSKTITGPLPPSSSSRCLSHAARATASPVRVPPVRPTASTPRCVTSPWATTTSSVNTRLTSPGGTPAPCSRSIETRRDAGAGRRGLPDHGTAGRHCGTEVLNRDVEGKVPRSQDRPHATWLTDDDHPLGRVLDRRVVPVEAARRLGCETEAARARGDLTGRLVQRLSLLLGEVGGQPFGARLDRRSGARAPSHPLGESRPAGRGERVSRRAHRGVHGLSPGAAHVGEQLAGSRAAQLEDIAAAMPAAAMTEDRVSVIDAPSCSWPRARARRASVSPRCRRPRRRRSTPPGRLAAAASPPASRARCR